MNLNAVEMKIKHIPPVARNSERPLQRLSIISSLCRCWSGSHPHDIIKHSPAATRLPGKAPKNVNASVTYISIPFLFIALSPAEHRKTWTTPPTSFFPPRTSKSTLMSAQWLVALRADTLLGKPKVCNLKINRAAASAPSWIFMYICLFSRVFWFHFFWWKVCSWNRWMLKLLRRTARQRGLWFTPLCPCAASYGHSSGLMTAAFVELVSQVSCYPSVWLYVCFSTCDLT